MLIGLSFPQRRFDQIPYAPYHMPGDRIFVLAQDDSELSKYDHENNGNHGRDVFRWYGEACRRRKSHRCAPCDTEKPRTDWINDLQICCEGRKSRKRPTLVVGKKPYGKSQIASRESSCDQSHADFGSLMSNYETAARPVTGANAGCGLK
jgi:hypothetical protein